MDINTLDTGDIILYKGRSPGCWGFIQKLIKCGTKSNYTHVAMVLRDPVFANETLKGLYIWESSWNGTPDPQDNKTKLGVQITPFSVAMRFGQSDIYVRKLVCPIDRLSVENLQRVHEHVYDKPYNLRPIDWVRAWLSFTTPKKVRDRFWCSALIGYIYTECGIFQEETNWSMLRPVDFSSSKKSLPFSTECYLDEEQIKLETLEYTI